MTFSIRKKHPLFFGLIFALLIAVPLLSLPAETSATSHGITGNAPKVGDTKSLPNPLGKTTIADLLKRFLEAMVRLGVPVAILFLVYTGFLFIKAQGNETQLQTAKRSLLYTIIGIGVLIGAQTLAVMIDVTIKSIRG